MTTMFLAVGNAGGNIIDFFRHTTERSELKSAQFVYVDCDEKDLQLHASTSNQALLLKSGNGDPIFNIFEEVDKLVIVTVLGGRIGTKFTELVAKSAINAGVSNVSVIATIPFSFEGETRVALATEAAKRLTEIRGVKVNIFKNESLLTKYPDLNILNAFQKGDKEIMLMIENLYE